MHQNGSVITSRRKPSPGMIALKATGWATMSVNSRVSNPTSSPSPTSTIGEMSGW